MRIEVAGLVLKPSGAGFVVGEPKPRTINGRETEEIRDGRYYGDVESAARAFAHLAYSRVEPWSPESRLLFAFWQLSYDSPPRVLTNPAEAVEMLLCGRSIREFCRATGHPYATVQGILTGRDPRCSTLRKLLGNGAN